MDSAHARCHLAPFVRLLMKLRRAREDESPKLSALAIESKAYWPYSQTQIAAWRESLSISAEMIRSLPTYVAEAEQQVVGFFLLAPKAEQWQLEHFWVHPSRIGRGVGRFMLREAGHIAAEAGATSLLIEADPNAEPFYVACGASRVGQIPAPIEGAETRVLPLLVFPTKQSNPSIERTSQGLRPCAASHVKR